MTAERVRAIRERAEKVTAFALTDPSDEGYPRAKARLAVMGAEVAADVPALFDEVEQVQADVEELRPIALRALEREGLAEQASVAKGHEVERLILALATVTAERDAERVYRVSVEAYHEGKGSTQACKVAEAALVAAGGRP